MREKTKERHALRSCGLLLKQKHAPRKAWPATWPGRRFAARALAAMLPRIHNGSALEAVAAFADAALPPRPTALPPPPRLLPPALLPASGWR
jgi:hypothetical protein